MTSRTRWSRGTDFTEVRPLIMRQTPYSPYSCLYGTIPKMILQWWKTIVPSASWMSTRQAQYMAFVARKYNEITSPRQAPIGIRNCRALFRSLKELRMFFIFCTHKQLTVRQAYNNEQNHHHPNSYYNSMNIRVDG